MTREVAVTQTELPPFVHRYEPGSDDGPPLLLLHGTGGGEDDLLPLGRNLAPEAAMLSPRGRVLENGMPRFFRRLAEGVFDEDDLRARVDELAGFIADARSAYGLEAPLAFGFSNGANVAAAMLLQRPEVLSGAVLLRAMAPFRQPPEADLAGKPVLLVSGAADPIVPEQSARLLADQLRSAGAEVEFAVLPAGHGLTQADLARVGPWLTRRRQKALR